MNFPPYQKVRLTVYQQDLVKEFFQDNPELYYRETLIHRFNPLSNLEQYMWEELFGESFHCRTREKYIRFGVLSDLDVITWKNEELHEYPQEQIISLNTNDKRIIENFFKANPEILQREINIHFFNPLEDLEKYFYQELYNEPYHGALRRKYEYQGEIRGEDIHEWMKEERKEGKRHSSQFY